MHTDVSPLHRAFSCYVFGPHDRLLVTQRAVGKATFPAPTYGRGMTAADQHWTWQATPKCLSRRTAGRLRLAGGPTHPGTSTA